MSKLKKRLVSLICPVYNEAPSVHRFVDRASALARELAAPYVLEVIFIDDGSKDETLQTLISCQAHYPWIRIVELSRNFGKEAALSCGIDLANGDCAIPIDVDLEDPLELIPQMIEIWESGFEVVLAKRESRPNDSWMKRTSATFFYRIHNRLATLQLPQDVGDFRLLDRIVIDALKSMPERQRFMKGLFAWVGFKQATIGYVRGRRDYSESRFSFWKLWNLAVEGITSFSTLPLRIWTYLGLFIAVSSMGFGLFIIGHALFLGREVPGYASMMTVILFLGGIQLIGLGVIGEYLGRNYMESKGRPIYVIRRQFPNQSMKIALVESVVSNHE